MAERGMELLQGITLPIPHDRCQTEPVKEVE